MIKQKMLALLIQKRVFLIVMFTGSASWLNFHAKNDTLLELPTKTHSLEMFFSTNCEKRIVQIL